MNEKDNEINIVSNHNRDLGIYIHIPFCAKKCNYCDFLSAPANDEMFNKYVNALLIEIGAYSGKTKDYIVPTIFIGGGTPSILKGDHINRIMKKIIEVFKVDFNRLEATIEANPGTLTKDKLLHFQEAGINRISFGLQSVNNKELKLLGRIHSYEEFLENYNLARELGFNNINIDLMSALPGQTLKSWEETLTKTIALQPEHISAYSLIIEEGTPFYLLYNENGPLYKELPDEETDRSMYHMTKSLLESQGYHRYEISNYAKPGFESRHNSSYWTGVEYIGFGLGASSLIDGVRFNNQNEIMSYISRCNEYLENKDSDKARVDYSKGEKEFILNKSSLLKDPIGIRENLQELSLEQKMEEFMFLGLRMQEGIKIKDFIRYLNHDIYSVYGDIINKHKNNGLLMVTDERIYLTEYGFDVSNYVLSDFIID